MTSRSSKRGSRSAATRVSRNSCISRASAGSPTTLASGMVLPSTASAVTPKVSR
ncbi:Uncharacterised protein [Bordetella pertussis]|nr:Uncharacterised protein [Bordetella pertussis]